MNQRYEILYKNNEFLNEYLGRDMKVLHTTGKELANSSTLRDITHRILKEHWKMSDTGVSPAKIIIWSNDKDGYINQLSASHLVYDKKEKKTFSDLLNVNFCTMIQNLVSAYNSTTKNANLLDDTNTSYLFNFAGYGVNFFNSINGACGGLFFEVGKGSQTGNLRLVPKIATPFTVVPENGALDCSSNASWNNTTGILSNGTSFSSGETGTISEVVTESTWETSVAAQYKNVVFSYDLVNFGITTAQLVNLAFVIQL